MNIPRYATFAVVVAVLIVSIPSAKLIPFYDFLGLDFHNLDVFHDCVARDNPYLATGAACGDVGARDMVYPPLLYWLFVWTRFTSLSAGALIWAAATLLGVLGSLIAWTAPRERNILTAIFIGLLIFQYPSLFLMERGNNDVIVLVAWTLAACLFASGRFAASGAAAGFAAAVKVYPLAACAVVGVGLVGWAIRHERGRASLLRFAAGGLLVAVLVAVVFLDQNLQWLSEELPGRAAWVTPLFVYSHSLDGIAPWGLTWLLSLPLLGVWAIASVRMIPTDPAPVFAGALAMSTYFFSSSWDYNLITTYPLLLLQFLRVMRNPRAPLDFALLVLGLMAIVGHRTLFDDSELQLQLHVFLQWAWLIASGVAAVVWSRSVDGARSLQGAAVPSAYPQASRST